MYEFPKLISVIKYEHQYDCYRVTRAWHLIYIVDHTLIVYGSLTEQLKLSHVFWKCNWSTGWLGPQGPVVRSRHCIHTKTQAPKHKYTKLIPIDDKHMKTRVFSRELYPVWTTSSRNNPPFDTKNVWTRKYSWAFLVANRFYGKLNYSRTKLLPT